jgi:hypothetical protein
MFLGRTEAKETYLIKDDEGYTTGNKKYIRNHPELFRYIGMCRINSVIVHTFEFLG